MTATRDRDAVDIGMKICFKDVAARHYGLDRSDAFLCSF